MPWLLPYDFCWEPQNPIRYPFETLYSIPTPVTDHIYGNSYNLHQFALNREAARFSETLFLIDRLHLQDHVSCIWDTVLIRTTLTKKSKHWTPRLTSRQMLTWEIWLKKLNIWDQTMLFSIWGLSWLIEIDNQGNAVV